MGVITNQLGEGPAYDASAEEIASQANLCNQKKKSAKIAGVSKIGLLKLLVGYSKFCLHCRIQA